MSAPRQSNCDGAGARRGGEVIDWRWVRSCPLLPSKLEAEMRRTRWAPALMVAALLIGACQPTAPTGGGKPAKLTIAAAQGNDDAALKVVAPLHDQQAGIKNEIAQHPDDQP